MMSAVLTIFKLEQGTQQTRSRISKAVKKLVSNEEQEKMKEEMAWQVAEMFVKEVTSVTMSEEHQELIKH